MKDASWWSQAPGAEFPRVGWLGVFRRPVRLTPGLPKRMNVPLPKVGPALRLISESGSPPQAGQLPIEAVVPRAGQMRALYNLTMGPGGSVDVSGDAVQHSPQRALGRAPGVHVAGVELAESSQSDSEIPLWKRLRYLLQPPAALLLSDLSPIQWPAQLFDYQLDGVRALLSADALLLADDMGLGKTMQAIAATRILVLQRRVEHALFVVPASLIIQWRKAIHEWAPELRVSTVRGVQSERAWQWDTPAHVHLTSYETLREDFTPNSQSPPRRIAWDLVVLDEAQKIKNRSAEVARKCKLLTRRRAWALTGTPLENSLDDLASILEFTAPLADGAKPQRFFPGPALLAHHATLQLRRKKRDVLSQLPPKLVSEVTLALEGEQRKTYERAENEGVLRLREQGEAVRIENVLELIMRLKQICNFCTATGQSAKMDDLVERIRVLASEGHRALVFSQFTDERYGVGAVAKQLAEFKPLIYTGALSASDKERVIDEFKNDAERKVLVLSLRAGGQGLNLQEASYVVHFDRWWNPAVEHQAEDRSHRIGQVFPVTVFKYLCEGTIEERIDKVLRAKQRLFDELVDDVSLDLRSRLSGEEIFGLFGLAPPRAEISTRRGEGPLDYGAMTGVQFEEHVRKIVERRGWKVESTPASRDGGIDLIARWIDSLGLETVVYVQCKNTSAPIGVEIVRELNGVLATKEPGARGVIACPSGFTAEARKFAQRRIDLWERHDLFSLGGAEA